MIAAVAIACGSVLAPAVTVSAAEAPEAPPPFAAVAARARTASIVVRVAGTDAAAEDAVAVPAGGVPDEDIHENGDEPIDTRAARRERTVGAGVVVDPRGFAVTSARAVSRARALDVSMIDGTPLKATIVAVDAPTDVAVLRLVNGAAVLPYLPFGDSDRLELGDWVLSIGNPFGLEGTVTAGVVTATPTLRSSNPLASYVQTDAVMGEGNFGGPLVNLSGEIVGLGTTLRGDGVAYATPSNTVRRVLLELLEKGRVSRPWLGIVTQSLTPALARALRARNGTGVLIADVRADGPAANAGVQPGDIVAELGAIPISSRLQFERAARALRPGERVTLRLRRDGRERTLAVSVGEDPEGSPPSGGPAITRRRLGLGVQPFHPVAGVVAGILDAHGAAARAGLRPGDIIREVDRRPVRTPAELETMIRALPPGTPVLMRIQRRDDVLFILVNGRE